MRILGLAIDVRRIDAKAQITQPPVAFGVYEVHIAQLASLMPVQPLAKLTVTPADFPFLTQVRVHDDQRLQEYADSAANGRGMAERPSTDR
jgi:hypothetical protein